jgi:glycosyltransferase involved in cell wall biosynthesis
VRRVLLVQPSLQPPGGGNGVAAWVLQALVRQHRVTVLSWNPVAVEPINRFFGTSLRHADFDRLLVPASWRYVPERLPVPAALLRSAILMRVARRVHDAFDVLIGVNNEMDFGRRGIQYVHYPTYWRPRPEVDFRWYHRLTPLLNTYYRVADALGDFSMERMKANVTLTNSDWTADNIRRFLGIDARTVYPPVADPAASVPWDERRSGLVAVGRISPEKDYDRIMRVVAEVRAQIPGLTLTIVGTSDRHTRRYERHLRAEAASLGSWIDFRIDLSREQVAGLMAQHRYGIHGMRAEHFGMAPAEMVRAGMIVWVPNGGGQVEIVGRHPSLVYDTDAAASATIRRVLGDAAEQARLRTHLAHQATLFSTERFMTDIQEIVRDFRD